MLSRAGAGRVKHLSTKQLWVQAAEQAYGDTVPIVRRETNHGADFSKRTVGEMEFNQGFIQMGFSRKSGVR